MGPGGGGGGAGGGGAGGGGSKSSQSNNSAMNMGALQNPLQNSQSSNSSLDALVKQSSNDADSKKFLEDFKKLVTPEAQAPAALPRVDSSTTDYFNKILQTILNPTPSQKLLNNAATTNSRSNMDNYNRLRRSGRVPYVVPEVRSGSFRKNR